MLLLLLPLLPLPLLLLRLLLLPPFVGRVHTHDRCARMAAKVASDHANEAWPKSAANTDMSRCAMTFSSADDLKRAYADCVGASFLQALCRC